MRDVHAHPIDVIGLELRVAFAAIGSGSVAAGDNDFWLRKCRELCLRPAVEPLLLAHWAKLKGFAMSDAQIAGFSAQLCGSGQRQQPRTRDCYGLWEGGDVRFEPAERARTWWDDIRAAAGDPQLTPLLPAYAFARTIIAHPYPEGNGRLARALVHGALARLADLRAPALALAPAFYRNGAKLAVGLRALSASGDWGRFHSLFDLILRDAASSTARIET